MPRVHRRGLLRSRIQRESIVVRALKEGPPSALQTGGVFKEGISDTATKEPAPDVAVRVLFFVPAECETKRLRLALTRARCNRPHTRSSGCWSEARSRHLACPWDRPLRQDFRPANRPSFAGGGCSRTRP